MVRSTGLWGILDVSPQPTVDCNDRQEKEKYHPARHRRCIQGELVLFNAELLKDLSARNVDRQVEVGDFDIGLRWIVTARNGESSSSREASMENIQLAYATANNNRWR